MKSLVKHNMLKICVVLIISSMHTVRTTHISLCRSSLVLYSTPIPSTYNTPACQSSLVLHINTHSTYKTQQPLSVQPCNVNRGSAVALQSWQYCGKPHFFQMLQFQNKNVHLLFKGWEIISKINFLPHSKHNASVLPRPTG